MPRPTTPTCLLALCATLGLATPASHAADPEFSLGAHLRHHRIDEHAASGARLLTETGWLPTLEAGLAQALPAGRLAAQLSWSGGSLDYDGHSQTGSAFSTRTDQRILRGGLAYSLPVGPSLDLLARWEIEHRQRDIRSRGGVLGLDEDYRQQLGAIGLVWAPSARLAGSRLSAEWLTGLGSRQSVRVAGYIDPVTLPGNAVRGARLGARLPLGGTAGGTRLALVPQLEYLHADRGDTRSYRSGGVTAGTITQPDTTRWQAGAGLEITW